MVVISQGSAGRGGAPHQQWRRILWSCRDTFRVQIGRLLVHTLSPSLPLSDRKEALEFVFDSRHLDILKESLSPGLEVRVKEMHHYRLFATFPSLPSIRPENNTTLVIFTCPMQKILTFICLCQRKV